MRCDDGDGDDAARTSDGVLFCSTRGSVDGSCKMLVKKKDALEVESCAMMKVGCHRRRDNLRQLLCSSAKMVDQQVLAVHA